VATKTKESIPKSMLQLHFDLGFIVNHCTSKDLWLHEIGHFPKKITGFFFLLFSMTMDRVGQFEALKTLFGHFLSRRSPIFKKIQPKSIF
jgi:hypothetical protein